MPAVLDLIVLILRSERVLSVERRYNGCRSKIQSAHQLAAQEFHRLIHEFENAYITWYDERLEPYIRPVESWPDLIETPLEVLHLGFAQNCDQLARSIGYVDFDSPFLLQAPQGKRYPTWLIASIGGIGLARTFKAAGCDPYSTSLAEMLFGAGYRGVKLGLCPYSEPSLLRWNPPSELLSSEESKELCATIIRSCYGTKWLAFWLAAMFLFEKTIPVRALLALSYKSLKTLPDIEAFRRLHPPLDEVPIQGQSIEVIVPTFGRPEMIADVLRSLVVQTLLPTRVIIVEQNPDRMFEPVEMYLKGDWPFEVRLHSVSWVGACRARNLGMNEIKGDWILLLDDDMRITPCLLQYLVEMATIYRVDAISGASYLPHQAPDNNRQAFPHLWPGFDSGISLISKKALSRRVAFDERLEWGYGEDYEFGIQLRKNGANVLFAPGQPTLHLKSPSGGFRYSFPHPWRGERVQPKPSPVQLFSRRKHTTQSMQHGHALYYWLKRLSMTPVHRWPREIVNLWKGWGSAVKWVKHISSKNLETATTSTISESTCPSMKK